MSGSYLFQKLQKIKINNFLTLFMTLSTLNVLHYTNFCRGVGLCKYIDGFYLHSKNSGIFFALCGKIGVSCSLYLVQIMPDSIAAYIVKCNDNNMFSVYDYIY